eukprot:234539-Prymnesium_polylepis.1
MSCSQLEDLAGWQERAAGFRQPLDHLPRGRRVVPHARGLRDPSCPQRRVFQTLAAANKQGRHLEQVLCHLGHAVLQLQQGVRTVLRWRLVRGKPALRPRPRGRRAARQWRHTADGALLGPSDHRRRHLAPPREARAGPGDRCPAQRLLRGRPWGAAARSSCAPEAARRRRAAAPLQGGRLFWALLPGGHLHEAAARQPQAASRVVV